MVSFPLEQPSSSPDTYLYLKDDCEDAGCTETLVLEVVAAIELATSECVGVEDEPSDPLAELIADIRNNEIYFSVTFLNLFVRKGGKK